MLKNDSGNAMPLEVGIIHLVGIGGIGMSGIAEILHNLGYRVKGSDIAESGNVERLRKMGIEVTIGHRAENVADAAAVVISSAVKEDNPEVIFAREKKIPVVKRAEMLAEITRLKSCVAIAGTHGKTTTTAMAAALFTSAGLDPTVINGGIINAYGTNAYLGRGDWMVVEADESDGTFIRIPATVGVITNIDPEHLDFYGSFAGVKKAFRTFIENLPFYGFAVACADHKVVKKIVAQITDRRIYTYSVKSPADVRARRIKSTVTGSVYDAEISARLTGAEPKILKNIHLNIPGIHNVQNSLSVITIAAALKIPDSVIYETFANFRGVKRRFTVTGEAGGITVIDDYGHHPREIAATLQAARDVVKTRGEGRIIAVMQPHRFSRLRDLWNEFALCFSDADEIIIAEVYAAGEQPISGITSNELIKNVADKTGKKPHALNGEKDLPELISRIARPGDLVVCLGAGNITYWANALPDNLKKCKV